MLLENTKVVPTIGGIQFENTPVNSETIEGLFTGELSTADGPAPAIFFKVGSGNTVVWLFLDEADRDAQFVTVKTTMAGGGGADLAALTSLLAQMGLNSDEIEPKLDVLHADSEAIKVELETLSTLVSSLGNENDSPAATDVGTATIVSLLKRLNTKLGAKGRQTASESVSVVLASDSQPMQVRSGSQTLPITIGNALGSTTVFEVGDYASLSFDLAGLATSMVLAVEGCNTENGTYRPLQIKNLATGAMATTINAVGLYQVLSCVRYVRLRVSTAGTAGATSGTGFAKALAAA